MKRLPQEDLLVNMASCSYKEEGRPKEIIQNHSEFEYLYRSSSQKKQGKLLNTLLQNKQKNDTTTSKSTTGELPKQRMKSLMKTRS